MLIIVQGFVEFILPILRLHALKIYADLPRCCVAQTDAALTRLDLLPNCKKFPNRHTWIPAHNPFTCVTQVWRVHTAAKLRIPSTPPVPSDICYVGSCNLRVYDCSPSVPVHHRHATAFTPPDSTLLTASLPCS